MPIDVETSPLPPEQDESLVIFLLNISCQFIDDSETWLQFYIVTKAIHFPKLLDLGANDTIPMEPDEIVCLASTNVPEGSHDECTMLTNDLWEYGQGHPVPAIFINKDTATEYQKSLEGRTGVITCQLQLASLDGST